MRINDLIGTGTPPAQAQAIAGTFGAVTAAGSNSQANATLIAYSVANVTAAGGADSVVLPTAAQGTQPGDEFWVHNASATTAKLFPGGSDTINGSSSAVSVAQNKTAVCKRCSSTDWGLIITA